ncbi:MAG: fluoride efflux transporter CrcB [Hyphomicrobiaceae bacterium]
MQHILVVGAGGALGAVARYAVTVAALRIFGPAFPWGTLAVNVVGSFLMGVLAAALLARAPDAMGLRLFLLTGVLGGFTTFSAFSLDAVNLVERGAGGLAFVYVVGSVILSIAACMGGLAFARTLTA